MNVKRRDDQKFFYLLLILAFAAVLFTIQFCRSDPKSAERSNTSGIPTGDSAPSWSPDGARIAFQSKIGSNIEIYVMDADGSNQTQLTDNPADDEMPSWSPDSSRIIFTSNRDGNRELYVMNADGSDLRRLTNHPANDWEPSWSPDGKKIAFESSRGGNRDIFVMNSDGSNPMRLTDNPSGDRIPSWSPDGKKIVFVSDRDGNMEIFTMNADGTDQIRLTKNRAIDWYPAWSPDGKRIVFDSNRDKNRNIYIMNADGSSLKKLTDDPAGDFHPAWSPDGRKIAFASGRDFDAEVYVMDADGSNPINLTKNAPANKTFELSPVSQSELDLKEIPYKILFESFRLTKGNENWEICQINPDGSEFINLTNTPEIDELYPRTSPDGTQICFVAVEGESKESRSRNVYIMNRDGSDRVKIAVNAFQPCWSADGKYIAYLPGEYPRFNPDFRANKGLEIYELETGKKTRHPNKNLDHLFYLCWSPDGKWFVASAIGPIIAFKADDETMMTLSLLGCTPDISPDGKQLAWNGEDMNLNIGTLNFDSPQSSVTDQKVVVACDREYWVFHADWSPDGNYLAFSYAPRKGGHTVGYPAPGSNICICDLSTGKWTLVTTDGKSNKEPDWIPVQIH
jgi:Tol biopolymer transport system component